MSSAGGVDEFSVRKVHTGAEAGIERGQVYIKGAMSNGEGHGKVGHAENGLYKGERGLVGGRCWAERRPGREEGRGGES